VTTAAVSSITSSTADSGGEVTADGGSPVTARGVCWSTTANPTTADSTTADGTGSGAFTSKLTGLSPGITYHVRAYATNSVGTAYGSDLAFTADPGLPSITLLKTSSFDPDQHDSDSSGTLTPGDSLLYTVVATNSGLADALDVMIDDAPDANTTLDVATTSTTQGVLVTGDTDGDTAVSVDVGNLAASGGTVTVTFEVTINDPLAASVAEVSNQAFLTGSNVTTIPSDDPDSSPTDDPTVDTISARVQQNSIPTLSGWNVLLFTLILAAMALASLISTAHTNEGT
jgi:uncharacterized repeat protein (TIGR01451 family)